LYLGLFISPFVIVFSVSVFFLVHAWRPGMSSEQSTTRTISLAPLPADWKTLTGRPLVDAFKSAFPRLSGIFEAPEARKTAPFAPFALISRGEGGPYCLPFRSKVSATFTRNPVSFCYNRLAKRGKR
jgi:hypothetical protein